MAIVREAYGFVHADDSRLKEVYGGPSGQVFVECMRIRPDAVESKTVILFTHPIGGGAFLPLVTSLAHAGRHVIFDKKTKLSTRESSLVPSVIRSRFFQ